MSGIDKCYEEKAGYENVTGEVDKCGIILGRVWSGKLSLRKRCLIRNLNEVRRGAMQVSEGKVF